MTREENNHTSIGDLEIELTCPNKQLKKTHIIWRTVDYTLESSQDERRRIFD